jgi:hypothetical protein
MPHLKLRVRKARRCASRLCAGSHVALHGVLAHLQGILVREEGLVGSRFLSREASPLAQSLLFSTPWLIC